MRVPRLVVTLTAACILVAATGSSAEWFTDVYWGAAFTQAEDTTAAIPTLGVRVTEKSNPGTSGSIGGRAGYWFRVPGIAIDASHCAPGEDLNIFPVSLLVMLRWPVQVSARFPRGQVQPYVAAGPGLFISRTDADVLGEKFSDTSADVGLDARAGITWMFAPGIGFFGEYRFTHFEAGYEDTVFGLRTTLDTKVPTHHLVVGGTFRF
jgi:opacity protein-like surface antigen